MRRSWVAFMTAAAVTTAALVVAGTVVLTHDDDAPPRREAAATETAEPQVLAAGATGPELEGGVWSLDVPYTGTPVPAPGPAPEGLQIGPALSLESPQVDAAPGGARATITVTRAQPVPEDEGVALGYWDETDREWVVVPTALSEDRRTLRAPTDHLSVWGQVHYFLSDVIGNRADPPTCSGKASFVRSVVFLDDENGPGRWCSGRGSALSTELLDVRVVVNRGYGMAAFPQTPATSSTATGGVPYGVLSLKSEVLVGFADTIKTIPALRRLVEDGVLVPPGEQAQLGFDELHLRARDAKPLVRLERDPSYLLAGLMYEILDGVTGDLKVTTAAERTEVRRAKTVAALVTASQCAGALVKAVRTKNPARVAAALTGCVTDSAEQVATALAAGFAKSRSATVRKLFGRKALAKALGRVTLAGTATLSLGDFIGDATLDAGSYELTAFATTKPANPCAPAVLTRAVRASGLPGYTAVVERCEGGWAYVGDAGGMGDTEVLLRYRDKTWTKVTGFPTTLCGSDLPESAPDWVVAKFDYRKSECGEKPDCDDDATTQGLCRFVLAVQEGDLSGLSAEERRVAATASDLPKRTWSITSCELEGDITVLCEIAFDPRPGELDVTSAGFHLQPSNAEYDGDGGVIVAPGEKIRYAVISYDGLGEGGSFGEY